MVSVLALDVVDGSSISRVLVSSCFGKVGVVNKHCSGCGLFTLCLGEIPYIIGNLISACYYCEHIFVVGVRRPVTPTSSLCPPARHDVLGMHEPVTRLYSENNCRFVNINVTRVCSNPFCMAKAVREQVSPSEAFPALNEPFWRMLNGYQP